MQPVYSPRQDFALGDISNMTCTTGLGRLKAHVRDVWASRSSSARGLGGAYPVCKGLLFVRDVVGTEVRGSRFPCSNV
jgi:hypothetical protein